MVSELATRLIDRLKKSFNSSGELYVEEHVAESKFRLTAVLVLPPFNTKPDTLSALCKKVSGLSGTMEKQLPMHVESASSIPPFRNILEKYSVVDRRGAYVSIDNASQVNLGQTDTKWVTNP